jgi:plasmid stability protein
MKAITLRNLPPEIEKAILERAERQGESLNKAVIGILKDAINPAPRAPLDDAIRILTEEPMSEETAKIMWDSLRDGRRLFQKDWPGHKID